MNTLDHWLIWITYLSSVVVVMYTGWVGIGFLLGKF